MKISKKQTIGENLLYFMVWSAIFLVPVLNSLMMSEMEVSFDNVLFAWRKIIPYFVIFIAHNSILAPRLMLRRKYIIYLITNLILIIGIFGLVEQYDMHFSTTSTLFQSPNSINSSELQPPFSDLQLYWNVMLGFFMTGANTGIKLMYQSIRDEQKMKELKSQNMEAEMEYLKYQINPHFFMNTLNNIHALVDIDSEYAKNAIVELSKMMRYVLYDSGREKISINNDIQFIKNYIELMRIRYTDAVKIEMNYPHSLPETISIPPLLLIVFIENAFKHGISYQQPSYIDVTLEYQDGFVTALFTNSNHTKVESGANRGIGLQNVRKRLSLIYGERNYTLKINEADNSYSVKLIIPILNA